MHACGSCGTMIEETRQSGQAHVKLNLDGSRHSCEYKPSRFDSAPHTIRQLMAENKELRERVERLERVDAVSSQVVSVDETLLGMGQPENVTVEPAPKKTRKRKKASSGETQANAD